MLEANFPFSLVSCLPRRRVLRGMQRTRGSRKLASSQVWVGSDVGFQFILPVSGDAWVACSQAFHFKARRLQRAPVNVS